MNIHVKDKKLYFSERTIDIYIRYESDTIYVSLKNEVFVITIPKCSQEDFDSILEKNRGLEGK